MYYVPWQVLVICFHLSGAPEVLRTVPLEKGGALGGALGGGPGADAIAGVAWTGLAAANLRFICVRRSGRISQWQVREMGLSNPIIKNEYNISPLKSL